MGRRRAGAWISATAVAAALATGSLPLAPAVRAQTPAQQDAFDRALAEIDEAIATNPNGVPEQSLESCRAMRKTAVLLRKMGQHTRAVRRIKACRKLLGIDDYRSGLGGEPGVAWPV